MSEVVLVVFARAPQRGRVKTRLAAEIGEVRAVQAYARLLGLALVRASRWDGPRAIACANAASLDYFQALPEASGFHCFMQEGADLGTRMRLALQRALAWAPAAVLMGTDVADLGETDLPDARSALSHADVVLGPTADGGYWLLGVRQDHPALFDALPWGTARVFSQTLQRCVGLQVRVLPMRSDVDDARALDSCRLPAGPALPEVRDADPR